MSVVFNPEFSLVENLNHIENNGHYIPVYIFDNFYELIKIFDYEEKKIKKEQINVNDILMFGINPLENWVDIFEESFELE